MFLKEIKIDNSCLNKKRLQRFKVAEKDFPSGTKTEREENPVCAHLIFNFGFVTCLPAVGWY